METTPNYVIRITRMIRTLKETVIHRNAINAKKMQIVTSKSIGYTIAKLYIRTGYLKDFGIARLKRIRLRNKRTIS